MSKSEEIKSVALSYACPRYPNVKLTDTLIQQSLEMPC